MRVRTPPKVLLRDDVVVVAIACLPSKIRPRKQSSGSWPPSRALARSLVPKASKWKAVRDQEKSGQKSVKTPTTLNLLTIKCLSYSVRKEKLHFWQGWKPKSWNFYRATTTIYALPKIGPNWFIAKYRLALWKQILCESQFSNTFKS